MKNFLHTAFRELLDVYGDKVEYVRENIILKKHAIYFDWTASGLANQIIENRIAEILPYYANTHSIASKHAFLIQELYKESKNVIRKSLGLSEDFVLLACGSGATGAIKKFQELLGIYIPPQAKKYVNIKKQELPLVVVGAFEHHSNEISFREGLCEVYRIPLCDDFSFDLIDFEKTLKKNKHRKIIVSCNVLSNVTGNRAPIEKISTIARKYGCIIALDMATSSVDISIDSSYFDACFLSPHKLIGGVGSCGILAIKKELIDLETSPSFAGGGVVKYVDRKTQIYATDFEQREEAGTPPLLQIFRSALVYQMRNEIGLDVIKQKKRVLMRVLLKGLREIEGIKIYGGMEHEGIVSFNIKGISPFILAHYLSYNYQIQTRAGCSCAGPYGHDLLGLEDGVFLGEDSQYGWLRVSLHYTHTLFEIEHLLLVLKKLVDLLRVS
ncbi:aminotransferase class V-fold PLP-dependent enzyme [Helicobacter anatolicus]|uniref:aminotransferase class V-fold PLP-dependent enzyme n=1 Tax=Helicobacter anatolicus TaxID=2905874 RepID=UPI001E4EAD1B|nr:aminotransferase class V-fold PLP-dependent enzyme [Helicobacter anatolicus]MCE3040363.1 aminotransferase class V-fold PLP-dependent enzyme [Helicobacter anatolicus]